MGQLMGFGSMARGALLVLLVCAVSSCGTEQGGPTDEKAGPPREVTKEVTKTVTMAEVPKKQGTSAPETARNTPASPPSGTSPAPPPTPTQAGSPEDVLALQYRLINAGDYEGAYALFDQSSKQLISPEQYRSYFEANAPYSITDYSFLSVDDRGDAATVQAAVTATRGSGQESYQASQPLTREGGAWRVVMRDEQASSFAAAGQEVAGNGSAPTNGGESAQYGSEPTTAPAPTQAASEYREPSAGAIPGNGTFLVGEDVQPGTYRTNGGDGCYWARLSDASGEVESIIANGNPQGPTTVTISASDGAFETNGCSDWTLR